MSGITHLGHLVVHETSTRDDLDFPLTQFAWEDINTAADNTQLDPKAVGDQALAAQKDEPAIWFVNFPNKEAATDGSKELKGFMDDVLTYRCWASCIWWTTVLGKMKNESNAKQSAYAAKVAIAHMKTTPWLALSSAEQVEREIRCYQRDFHSDLMKKVLEGFVGLTPGTLLALEGILNSLASTVDKSDGNKQSKVVVCERYQYIKEADAIKSYVKVIGFAVTQDMKNVQNSKKTENEITCKITYDQYEGEFNRRIWTKDAAPAIDQKLADATKDFVKIATVDVSPDA